MAIGDIGAVVDTLEFDTVNCLNPCMLHISGTVYVIAYVGFGSYGTIKTFNIAADGALEAAAIDSYIFLSAVTLQPKIVHVSGNVFAICYGGVDGDGFVSTVTIAANGTITAAIIDTIEYDLASGANADIINVSGAIFAMACPGDTNRGWLHTITINADGTINDTVIDSLQFTALSALYPNIIHVSGDVFAIVYTGWLTDGFIITVTIDSNGAIGNTVIETLEFDAGDANIPRIIHVAGNVFAIAYSGIDADGFLVTITISDAGAIGGAIIDSLEFDTGDCIKPHIIHVAGNVFAIAYSGVDTDGFLVTVTINDDGTIDDAVIGSFEFDAGQGVHPAILHIAGNVYAIAYNGVADDGFLITLGVETIPVSAVQHLMIIGVG